jgi:hypothetical protein
MNEEAIKAIWEQDFKDRVAYPEFRKEFDKPEVRQAIHKEYYGDRVDFNKFETDLGFSQKPSNTQQSAQPTQGATDQSTEQAAAQQDNTPEPESDFHKALGKLPFGGILQKGADAITRGLHQGSQLSEGIDALVAGKNLDEQQTQAVADILKQNKRDTESDKSITSKFMKDEHLTLPEWAGFVAETVVQSGAMMLRGFFDAFSNTSSSRVLAGGAASGIAVGSFLPGIGNIAGLTSGTLGSVSGMMEASGMYFDELQQEIDKRKLPLNASSVKQVISDDAWLSRVRERATVKGLVVGSVDAITAGLSAKLGSKLKDEIIKKGLEGTPLRKAVAKTAGKVLLNEMAGGGGGEAASEVAIGDPLDYHQIVPELVGELGGGANVVTPFLGEGGSEVRAAIAEAKERKIKEAGKTPPPSGPAAPAAPAEDLADKSLSIGDVIDAHTKLTINRDKDTNMIDQAMLDHSLSDMAVRHTKEEFNAMLEIQAKAEGLSAEEVQSISGKFDEAKQIADKFNTPDLMADPSTRSLAVKARLDANRVQSQIDETTKAMDSADEAVKPQWKAKLDDLNTQLKAHNDTISAIVNKKPVDNTSPAEKPKQQLSNQSQEEFAQYLQDNHSDKLSQEQIYNLLTVRPELRERMLNESPEEWAKIFEKNPDYRQQANNVDNNKEMRGNANAAWTGISIGDPSNKETDGRHKGYITLGVDSAREMGKNLEQTFKDLYSLLKDAGYNGHLKMPSTITGLLTRFDNIVIHGATKSDVSLALPVIEKYFKEKGLNVEGTKTGIDGKDSNGKETSHTNLLAEKVKNKQLTKTEQKQVDEIVKTAPPVVAQTTADTGAPVAPGVSSFKTSKGSEYTVNQDGTTVRNKSAHPEHPGDEGVKPKSEKTVYLTKDQMDKLSLVQATPGNENNHFVIAHTKDGKVGVGILTKDGKGDHGKVAPNTTVTPSTTPAVGLYPLETWNDGRNHHFGNQITEVTPTTNEGANLSQKDQQFATEKAKNTPQQSDNQSSTEKQTAEGGAPISAEKTAAQTEQQKSVEEHTKIINESTDAFEKANNANTNYIRTNILDMDPIKAKAIGVEDIIKEAQDKYITAPNDPHGAYNKEKDLVIRTKNGESLTAPQVVAVANALNQMHLTWEIHEQLRAQQEKMGADTTAELKILSDLEDDMDHFTAALNKTGTEAARALAIRKELLFNKKMDRSNMRTRFSQQLANYKMTLNEADKQVVDKAAADAEKANQELSKLLSKEPVQQDSVNQLLAKHAISELIKDTKSLSRTDGIKEALTNLDKVLNNKNC